MSMVAMRYKTEGLTRCAYCQRVSHHIYKVPFGDHIYNLCSGECVQRAQTNYDTNKNIIFTDTKDLSPDWTPEMQDE